MMREVERIKTVFNQALDLDPGEWPAFLDDACVADEELRREVESLLEHASSAEIVLAQPAWQHVVREMAEEKRESFIGRRIGHYHIEDLIGEGGMGEVYKAWDANVERFVALKMLPAAFTSDPERVQRFEHEALTVSRLNHPNIITIHDIIRADGDSGSARIIVSEYVEGRTLGEMLRGSDTRMSRRLSMKEVVEIAVQIADALRAAHAARVIHRDIKPDNIMVRPDGLVKVLDFGIARSSEGQADDASEAPRATVASSGHDFKTAPGAIVGTAGYMSPEQARGETVDHRTDLFSLGIVLYEMVSGRPPFVGRNRTEVRAAIIETEPPPLDQLAPDAPAQLRDLIGRSLEKDRERRYQTAAELLGDLEALKDELKYPSPRVSRRAWLALAAASASAAATLGYFGWRKFGQRDAVETTPLAIIPERWTLNFDGPVEEVDVSPDGGHLAFTQYDGAVRSLKVRELKTDLDTVIVPPGIGHDCHSLSFSRDGREIFYVADEGRRGLYRVSASGGAPIELIENVDSPVSFSPDGRQIAFMRVDDQEHTTALLIADAGGGGIRRIASRRHPEKISEGRPAWSPDGSHVAFAAGLDGKERTTRIYQASPRGDGERPLMERGMRGIHHLAWLSDDSGMVILATDPGNDRYRVWHLTFAGEQLRLLSEQSQINRSLGVTANGSDIYSISQKEFRRLLVMRGDGSGDAREIVSNATAGQFGIAWTPDDEIIYAGGLRTSQQLWIVDPDGRNNRRFSFNGDDDDAPSVSRDGRYVVYSSVQTPGSNNIYRMERQSGRLDRLTSGRLDVDPTITPDGKWVFYVSWDEGHVGSIWKTPLAGGPATQLTTGHTTNPRPAISPDGRMLAYCHQDDRGRRIEIARFDDLPLHGKPPLKVLAIPRETNLVRWSPDGSGLVYTLAEGNVGNLYRQPLDGRPHERMTAFPLGRISWFAWSLDGRRLALSSQISNREVIRISEYK